VFHVDRPFGPRPWVGVARNQHGVISLSQLKVAGETAGSVRVLLAHGHLRVVRPGLYLVGGLVQTFDSALWIAALAVGGVFVGTTAAYLWDMVEEHTGPIRVAVEHAARAKRLDGVEVVRSDRMVQRSSRRQGHRLARRSDAVLDHAASLNRAGAVVFVDRALSQGWVSRKDLAARLESPARGNGVLRAVHSTIVEGAEAESERLLHRLLTKAGLTGWRPNAWIRLGDGRRVRADVLFDAARLVIEVDGFRYHSATGRFQTDRSRQNALTLIGYTVLRFTWYDLTERPDYVLATILEALARSVR